MNYNRVTPPYIKDYGAEPFVINIEEATRRNNNFRTALWTGQHLQITLINIKVGESIVLESHPNLDQFIRIEQGVGLVQMGDNKNNLNYERTVYDNYAIVIPAGKWHNLTNIGNVPIKLYSIYAPPNHPKGTVHKTKEDAEHKKIIKAYQRVDNLVEIIYSLYYNQNSNYDIINSCSRELN